MILLEDVFILYRRDIFFWCYTLYLQPLFPIGFDVIIISGGVPLSPYPVFTVNKFQLFNDFVISYFYLGAVLQNILPAHITSKPIV